MTNRRPDPRAVALGRRGGLIGGPACARKLTAAQRSENARHAAETRHYGRHAALLRAAKRRKRAARKRIGKPD